MILARPVGKNPGKVYTSGTLSKTSIDNTGQNFFMETDIYSRFSPEIPKTSFPLKVDPGDCALITPPAKHNGIREPERPGFRHTMNYSPLMNDSVITNASSSVNCLGGCL
jgi:hypothetical protein